MSRDTLRPAVVRKNQRRECAIFSALPPGFAWTARVGPAVIARKRWRGETIRIVAGTAEFSCWNQARSAAESWRRFVSSNSLGKSGYMVARESGYFDEP